MQYKQTFHVYKQTKHVYKHFKIHWTSDRPVIVVVVVHCRQQKSMG